MIRAAGRLIAQLAAAVVTLVAVAAATAVLLLAYGPVSLDYVRPQVEAMLSPPGSPVRIDIGDLALAWSSERRQLHLQASQVEVRERDGPTVARLGRVGIVLRGAALLRGVAEPVALDIVGPRVRLAWGADGGIDLDLGELEATGTGEDAPAMLRRLAEQLPSLRRVSVVDAALEIVDRRGGASFRLEHARLDLRRRDAAVELSASGGLRLGEAVTRIVFDTVLGPDMRPGDVSIGFGDLELARLPDVLPYRELAPLRDFAMPVAGRVVLELDERFLPAIVRFDLGAGAGTVKVPGGPSAPLQVTAAGARGELRPASETLRLEDLFAQFDDGLSVQGGVLVWREPAGVGVRAEGTLQDLATDRLQTYWPPHAAAGARRWIVRNLRGGEVGEGRFAVDLRPGELEAARVPARAVSLEFEFADVTCRFWEVMPVLQGGRGHARLDADTFELTLAQGRVEGVALSEGRVRIPGLQERDQVASIDVRIEGPTAAALALLDRKPLGYAAAIGIKPAEAAGTSRTSLGVVLPLEEKLRFADVRVKAAARLDGFGVPALFQGLPARDGGLDIEVTEKAMRAQGSLTLGAAALDLVWRYDFEAPRSAYGMRYEVSTTVDGPALRSLGLELDHLFEGQLAVRLDLEEAGTGAMRGRVDADLVRAAVLLPGLGTAKPAGEAGRLRLQLQRHPDRRIELPSFAVDSASLTAQGALALAADGRMQRLGLARLRWLENDLALELAPRAAGGFDVRLGGRRLDLRPYLREADGPAAKAEPPAGPDLAIALQVGEVLALDGITLAQAKGRAARKAGRWTDVAVEGLLNGGTPVNVAASHTGAAQAVRVTAADAGGALRSLDLAEGVQGGQLSLDLLVPDDDRPIDGHAVIDRYRVKDAEVLTRILTLASLTGILDVLRGDGVQFTRFDGRFTVHRGVIAFEDARAVGPALGYVASGRIDRRNDALDIRATVVPAYSINQVLGRIPILGDLLIGRPGEGVFAVTARVTGSSEKPEVSVNPLSALAPGFLRRIVDGLGDGGGSAAAPQPEPPRN